MAILIKTTSSDTKPTLSDCGVSDTSRTPCSQPSPKISKRAAVGSLLPLTPSSAAGTPFVGSRRQSLLGAPSLSSVGGGAASATACTPTSSHQPVPAAERHGRRRSKLKAAVGKAAAAAAALPFARTIEPSFLVPLVPLASSTCNECGRIVPGCGTCDHVACCSRRNITQDSRFKEIASSANAPCGKRGRSHQDGMLPPSTAHDRRMATAAAVMRFTRRPSEKIWFQELANTEVQFARPANDPAKMPDETRKQTRETFDKMVRRLMVDIEVARDPECRLHHLERMHAWFKEHQHPDLTRPSEPFQHSV